VIKKCHLFYLFTTFKYLVSHNTYLGNSKGVIVHKCTWRELGPTCCILNTILTKYSNLIIVCFLFVF